MFLTVSLNYLEGRYIAWPRDKGIEPPATAGKIVRRERAEKSDLILF